MPQSQQNLGPHDLLDLASNVLEELDLDVVVDRALASARELTGARYAAVGLLDESGSELARFVTVGIDERTRAKIGALPRGLGVLGELIRDPVPLRLTNVGEHPRSYGLPIGHPPMRSFLGVPILVAGEPVGNLYLTEKTGSAEFTAADETSAAMLARFVGLAIDHARRYESAAARGDELARTVATLEATTEIARAVGGETNLDVILDLVAKRGRALVSARALLIELVDGSELVVAAVAGEEPAGLIGERFALAEAVASAALRTRTTQRLELPVNRSRYQKHDVGQLGVGADAGLVVPLIFHEQAYGVLLALDRLGDTPAFTAEEVRLLEAFATTAATAVATGRSAASDRLRERLAAAEGERGRWARELHDDTLQHLGGLQFSLSAARRSGSPEGIGQAVGEAIEYLHEGVANLRALITDLRPAALDEIGLAAALSALFERASRHGMKISSSLDLAYEQGRESTRHTSELETAIYRIIQEAMTNASKHGHAKRAVLELSESRTTVVLRVSDDGRGFDPGASTSGFGMRGMRERVELLHGTVTIESSAGHGAKLTATFPAQRRRPETPAPPPLHLPAMKAV